jgi:hypothetical protein
MTEATGKAALIPTITAGVSDTKLRHDAVILRCMPQGESVVVDHLAERGFGGKSWHIHLWSPLFFFESSNSNAEVRQLLGGG